MSPAFGFGRGPAEFGVPGVGALVSIDRNWCTPRAFRYVSVTLAIFVTCRSMLNAVCMM